MPNRKSKKKQSTRTTTVTVRPTRSPDITSTPRPRSLRARPRGGDFELVDGALDLGLVAGDVVWCMSGVDGRRYFAGMEDPRPGTLSRIVLSGGLCPHHASEFIDQATEDLRADGAISVQERGGTLRAFWPPEIPEADVATSVARSAAEYGLTNSILPERSRLHLIAALVDGGPPAPAHVA